MLGSGKQLEKVYQEFGKISGDPKRASLQVFYLKPRSDSFELIRQKRFILAMNPAQLKSRKKAQQASFHNYKQLP
jgi:hypothetical protein